MLNMAGQPHQKGLLGLLNSLRGKGKDRWLSVDQVTARQKKQRKKRLKRANRKQALDKKVNKKLARKRAV